MKSDPLVSVIITTRNEQSNIERCLQSVIKQSYTIMQIIVVDNNSDDQTKEIAKKFTKFVYNKGPERSAQRNFGAYQARGEYLLFLDADMILSENVVRECISKVKKNGRVKGIIIPEESIGNGFWAECKKLEKSFYLGVSWIEAARYYEKKAFLSLGGFNVEMISGEDWDMSQRIKAIGIVTRVESKIYHNEGNLSLLDTIKKKYYYAKNISSYLDKQTASEEVRNQTSVVTRYRLYFRDYKKLLKNPFVGLGMLFMKTCEFSGGALGLAFRTEK